MCIHPQTVLTAPSSRARPDGSCWVLARPPGRPEASNTVTSQHPDRCRARAAARPAKPAPTTAMRGRAGGVTAAAAAAVATARRGAAPAVRNGAAAMDRELPRARCLGGQPTLGLSKGFASSSGEELGCVTEHGGCSKLHGLTQAPLQGGPCAADRRCAAAAPTPPTMADVCGVGSRITPLPLIRNLQLAGTAAQAHQASSSTGWAAVGCGTCAAAT